MGVCLVHHTQEDAHRATVGWGGGLGNSNSSLLPAVLWTLSRYIEAVGCDERLAAIFSLFCWVTLRLISANLIIYGWQRPAARMKYF